MVTDLSLRASEPDLSALLNVGRVEAAFDILNRRRPHWTDEDWREVGNYGRLQLCLHQYQDAVDTFRLSLRMAMAVEKSRGVDNSRFLAGALWLAESRDEGANLWRDRVKGISSGSRPYADISGGIADGLLLWFAGVSLQRSELVSDAMAFLKKAAKRAAARSMPGPLASYVLGERPIGNIITESFGTLDIPALKARAATDLLYRRKLSQALHCWATGERRNGNEAACMTLMEHIASMANPFIQIEWFIARGEVERRRN
jgi:hypothetical protein